MQLLCVCAFAKDIVQVTHYMMCVMIDEVFVKGCMFMPMCIMLLF